MIVDRQQPPDHTLFRARQDDIVLEPVGVVASARTQFANPWHDEAGRFAPKGSGGGGGAMSSEQVRRELGTAAHGYSEVAYEGNYDDDGHPSDPEFLQMHAAIITYSKHGHSGINKTLRGQPLNENDVAGLGRMKPDDAVAGLDRAFEMGSARLSAPAVVHRQVSRDFAGTLTPGTTFTDRGYTSTTLDAGKMRNEMGSAGVLMEVRLPAGTRGMAVFSREDEMLLPRGTSFRVLSNNGADRGIVLEVTS